MNLTWHIVKKDLRALRWPLLVWLLLIITQLGIGVALLRADGSEGVEWFMRMDVLAKLLNGAAFVSFVLTAALIQEDLLVGTTAFWMTRPISGGRLLRAKLLSIGLVFGLLPVLVTLPWWLGCGYGLREIAWAAAETAAVQAIAVLLGLLWAATTDGFARFLMWTLVTLFTIPTLSGTLAYYVNRGHAGPSSDVLSTRLAVGVLLAVTGILIAVIHQFLTRRVWRSITVIGVFGGLIVLVAVFWPWSWGVESRLNEFFFRQARGEWPVAAEPPGLKFTFVSARLEAQHVGARPDRPFFLRTEYRVEGLTDAQGLMPYWSNHLWRWPDGSTTQGFTWSRSGMADLVEDNVLWAAMKSGGAGPKTDTIWNTANVSPAIAERLRTQSPGYTLQARLRLMKFESAGPVPLHPGARTLRDGSGERIAAVEKEGEQLLVTFIRHEPALLVDNAGGGLLAPRGPITQYFLVNQSKNYRDRGVRAGNFQIRIGTVNIACVTMAYRAMEPHKGSRLLLAAINALNDAELVKVTYAEQARFTHELKVDPLTVEWPTP